MLGRFISDLEKGDVLPSVSFSIPPAVALLLTSGFREQSESPKGGPPEWVPPTAVQAFKMRLLRVACPEGDGPHPKLVTSYRARHHDFIPVGRDLTMSGVVLDRFEKRGRTYLQMGFELFDKASNKVLVEYVDEQLLKFAADPR